MDILIDGLLFPEGTRWHDGKLFFSDFYRQVVNSVDANGKLEVVASVPAQPSGLGWLPDGRLLIVSMLDRKVLRQEMDGSLVEHADLSDIATWPCNDMLVDALGRAYVGNFGFDLHAGATPVPTMLIRVDPDGQVSVAASDLQFPNGTVITPDGATLIIGESFGNCLTAFDIDADGNLSNRRVWADIAPHVPDGICLDREGAIWVADPVGNCVIRVRQGGEITHNIACDRGVYACMLGGVTGNTLYVCTSKASSTGANSDLEGRIETLTVDVPRAGYP